MSENDIDDRYQKFMMMELPGQPMAMHMGTSTLVYDMHAEIARLRREKKVLMEALEAVLAHYREPQCLEALAPVIRAALRSATETKGEQS